MRNPKDIPRTDRGRFATGGLLQTVVALVEERGNASVEDIAAAFPGKSREQIVKAKDNAVQLGLIERVGFAPKIPGRRAARQAIYAPPGRDLIETDRPAVRGQYGIGKVSSIWDLGAGLGA